MERWAFTQSKFTQADRKTVWDFMSDMSNTVKMEPGVERVELDGPFVTGTKGRTIMKAYTQEWELSHVVVGKQFIITGYTPEGDLTLNFSWEFSDEGMGTRMTQHIYAIGTQLEKFQ